MLEKLIILAGGYLLGNPQAQKNVGNMFTKSIQMGIDTLNKKPLNDLIKAKAEPIEKVQE